MKSKAKGKVQKSKGKTADHAPGRISLFTFALCILPCSCPVIASERPARPENEY
jgi:hypothetical protein